MTLDRTIAPTYKPVVYIPLIKAETIYLKNKIPVHIIKDGEQPILQLEIFLKAGSWQEWQNNLAYFTIKLMGEGTKNLSAEEIHEKIAQYGAFIEFLPGYERSSIRLSVLTKYLEKLLPLVQEIFLQPSFPEKELANLKNITLQNLHINLEKNNYLASMRFREALFGEKHPYGRNISVTSIAAIEVGAIQKFYQENVNKRPEIIISGDANEQVINLLEKYWGEINFSETSTKAIPSEYVINSTIDKQWIKKKDSLQASIRIGKILFKKTHPDYFPMLVLNEVLGGYFGSRLMKNIREDKGFTYGIHSQLQFMPQQGYFTIGTDVKQEFAAQTLEEIYKEINILKQTLVPQEELENVKNYMIGSLANSLTNPFAFADLFKQIYFQGLDYNFYENYIQNINQVTDKQIQALANQYLTKESMIEIVVG